MIYNRKLIAAGTEKSPVSQGLWHTLKKGKRSFMVFSSLEFIFVFLPIFMIIYYFCPHPFRNAILFFASILFYSYSILARPYYLIIFIGSIIINYYVGMLIFSKRSQRRLWLVLGLLANFSVLFVFKYANFFLGGVVTRFFPQLIQENGRFLNLVLPIGISFYTFQSVSYLMDVYRRDVKAEYSFINFGMYISMFPQLIAGPIVVYSDIVPYVNRRKCSLSTIAAGTKIFIFGLGLKVLLANQLGGLWRALEDIGFDSISTQLAWMGIAARSFQIYFDFFGYSLMAIGLGTMMGFKLPQNFNHPYISTTMTEFWRRWHITLGTWFREYVYVPLGGNRRGELVTYRNLFIIWALTGLWHGASTNYLVWGIVLFILMTLERLFLGNVLTRLPVLGHLYMLFFIPVTWAIFSVESYDQLFVFFEKLFPFRERTASIFGSDYLKYGKQYWLFLLLGLLFSTKLPYKLYSMIKNHLVGYILLFLVFWLSVYAMYRGLDDPFLYFRF